MPLRSAITAALDRVLHRWDALALFPMVVVVAASLGGTAVLWACALVLPVLLAIQAWTRPNMQAARDPRAFDVRLSGADALEAAVDDALLHCTGTGRTTAVLMLRVDSLLMTAGEWAATLPPPVLDRVQARIALALRERDVVARCTEGTFGIVLHPVPRADLEITMSIVDRLQGVVSEPMSVEGRTIHLTCAIGVCLEERSPAPTGAAMIAAARCALRTAQRAEAEGVRSFTKEMQHQVEVEHQLASQVTQALDSGQIRPWFQPQVSTDTGTITGFEALARWHHPDLGVLTPAHFLPAIAASHAFVQLGEVVLLHALTALQSWDKTGICVPTVGINLSLDELRDPRLAERMAWQVDRFGLQPHRLCIEILETVTLQAEDDAVIRNLRALKTAGFKMDLDDFGTGHASIAHIARFGVERIKIDRSFVTDVDSDPEKKRLIAAILSMADHLGIETLAEGVETPAEHSTLAQLGCTHVQGFGIARPMPFEDTPGWAIAHNAKLSNAPVIRGKRLG
jgi:EAL domain-containing protein (putative c-di-GMP-specific phosphodiesterase class I)/GGDEF domain-containing protein